MPTKRKLHKKPTPLIGGIAIGFVLILSLFLFDFQKLIFNNILNLSLLIVLLGVVDDLKNLKAKDKLIFQSIPIFLLVFKYNLTLDNLGEYPIIGLIELGSFAPIFTLLSIFLFINACNYLDGIDGSFGLIYLSAILILYLNIENKDNDINYFYITISLPVIIFFFFNLTSFLPKVFLGDAGSLVLGYILACLMIISHNVYNLHPIIIAWSVNIIIYDFLFVNLERIQKGQNILKPGKDHIQHFFFKKTKSIMKSNLIMIGVNMSLAIFGIIIFKYINPLWSLGFFIILFYFYILVRSRL